jgi:hypothetical protein
MMSRHVEASAVLNDSQIAAIERDGFVTLDGPFSREEAAAAAAAADRAFDPQPEGFTGNVLAPEILRLIVHPRIEEAASRMLRAPSVYLWGVALRKTRPRPEVRPALEGEHADIRFTADDLDASPRRALCTVLLWLTDVTTLRAPTCFRPGSHRQLAQAYSGKPAVGAFFLPQLPALEYASPQPILARAGQISVGTTGVIHSGSVNTDTLPRMVVFLQFQARGTPRIEVDPKVESDTRAYMDRVRPLLEPGRRHLVTWDGWPIAAIRSFSIG